MKANKIPKKILGFTVNGEEIEIAVSPNDTLLEVLRERLDLTGVKEGCSEGVCGACTILMNNEPVRACLTLALEAEASDIVTIEGIADRGILSPLQEAFIEKGAVQCGFCSPGMIMSAKALLDRNPNPSIEEIKDGISGNFCRCTGYSKIIEAVDTAARKSEK